jgi:two-component system CheB/CheR fusion protein
MTGTKKPSSRRKRKSARAVPAKRAARKPARKTAALGAGRGIAAPALPTGAAAAAEAKAALPVVGMVASAGGLDAYIKFFKAMPPDSGMAFVLIPHLDPHRESLMAQLLVRHTAMPVEEATEGTRLAANRVYVIPPNKYLAIQDGVLHLTGPMERGGLETAIDAFLRSLAEDQQEKAIAVILSGTGSHGTLGVKTIKANGGMVMVQDPKTADQDRMPQSAIASGLADYILAPADMPQALIKYAQHFFGGAAVPETAPVPDDLTQVLALLRARTKFDFRSYRKRMLLRRIQRRMGLGHIATIGDYVGLLRERPEELKQLSKDLLICVTSFFRDPEMFQVLEAQVIPELLRAKPADAPLRVWVPACATGEEAYSVAMLLAEKIAATGKACPLQVFATDIEPEALEIARQGIYPDSIQADVSPERLARFFTRVDEHSYQVNKTLRETVLFAQQNVLHDAPFSKLDLVSCRNLLIYMELEVQQKVLLLLHFALNEGGYLVLGPSESIGHYVDLFEPVSKKWHIYRRIGLVQRERVELPIVAGETRPPLPSAPSAPLARATSITELTQQLLLEDYAPAAALIRRNYEVLYFHGPTQLYLQQPSGPPTQDLVALAREGLRARIRAAVHKALRENRRVNVGGGRVRRNGRYVEVRVSARPLHAPRAAEGLVLVSFEEESAPLLAPRPRGKSVTAHEAIVRQLEYELKSTREELQSTIEELESSNEELKASNEEVMSMNEELQSANEELETSKEELQSLNEELTTVNNQLQEKLDQLETTNNDMVNLLASADIATLFLGADHTIKRFTPAATRLFRLIATDVGRPIGDISWRFADAELAGHMEVVLRTLAAREKEVCTDDGNWYLRRVTPYRTLDNRIEGVVVAFTDITPLKRAEEVLRGLNIGLEQRATERGVQLAAERDFVAAVLETVGALIVVFDVEGRVVRCNKTCEQVSGHSAEDLRSQDTWDLLLLPEEKDEVMRVFSELRAGKFPNRHENHWRRRDGSCRLIVWSNTCLLDAGGRVEYIVATGIDVTDERYAEDEVRERQAELAHAHRVLTAGELATALAHELNQPLAAISTHSEACLQHLRRGTLEPDKLTRSLEQIALQAQRAGHVIRELREFLTKEETPRAPTDLNALVHTASDLIAAEARDCGVQIELDLAAELAPVTVARIQVKHALINLLQNAIEAIHGAGMSSGTVAVSTQVAADDMAEVIVHDTGPGLDPETVQRIFEPFYTTKPDGLGMGLAISRTIIEAHGGKFWANSDGGATFHFTLPLGP